MLAIILKVFVPAVLAFVVGVLITPFLSRIMYERKLWKRSGRSDSEENPKIAEQFQKVHNTMHETSTPRVGGIVVWGSILIVTLITWGLSQFSFLESFTPINFLSRSQTWLPLFALVVASLMGLADDFLQIYGSGKGYVDGLGRWQRVAVVALIGLVGGLWFFTKLGVIGIAIPFAGDLVLGAGIIILFAVVVLGTFSGSIIDGLDGLAGGVLATNFAAFGAIAYFQDQMNIAALCAVILGGILAFLWFNVPPARFYMGETGILGLTVTLAIIAFLTRSVVVLPIIALPLVVTSLSTILQWSSRKVRGKRLFAISPLHHQLQYMGWSAEKITMRYWIISVITSIIGVSIALLG